MKMIKMLEHYGVTDWATALNTPATTPTQVKGVSGPVNLNEVLTSRAATPPRPSRQTTPTAHDGARPSFLTEDAPQQELADEVPRPDFLMQEHTSLDHHGPS